MFRRLVYTADTFVRQPYAAASLKYLGDLGSSQGYIRPAILELVAMQEARGSHVVPFPV
jgi:hypothetical protein